MNFIDRAILRIAERKLGPFRETAGIFSNPVFAGYTEVQPLIQSLYSQAGYWHGTGRLQYKHEESTRYQKIDFNKTTDILESIISENGLRPHHEPWLEKLKGVHMPTISMTPFRMYGKLYAGLYLYEQDSLLYEFGSKKFWFRLLLAIQALNTSFFYFLLTRGLLKLARPSTYRNAQLWIRSIRNDNNKNSAGPFQGHLIRTDIPENYPILIGIRKSVPVIHFNRGMERLEARTDQPIRLEDITHIEVPFSKVEQTNHFLKEKNSSLLVIPLEFGELYSSSLELRNLLGIT